jgi:predicted transcriptional regulator
MNLSDELLTEMSYVMISQYRTKVMKSLDGKVRIPSNIAKDSGIRVNHVSKVLGELREHNLVECVNPEYKKGRLYRLTEKGESVTRNMDMF